MLKISDIIKEILENDEEAYFACQRGILNFSAYAREIKTDLEHRAKKSVNLKSVIVGLSRLGKDLKAPPSSLLAETDLSLSLHSSLAEVTYEKTNQNQKILNEVYQTAAQGHENYLVATQGLSEITIIGSQKAVAELKQNHKNAKPIFYKENLAGITVKFPEEFINLPNMLFAIEKRLAVKKINIIELVSTYTELTFVIDKK
ncbi:MAG: hypothetical protein Q8P32_00235, partial [Candidatus Komeilibacteria bacterium]|nr:hypothetical protein [Candidatus Komeilibacteria bacterium]